MMIVEEGVAHVSFIGAHGGRHYTGKQLQLCEVSLQGQGIVISLSRFVKFQGGKDLPTAAKSPIRWCYNVYSDMREKIT